MSREGDLLSSKLFKMGMYGTRWLDEKMARQGSMAVWTAQKLAISPTPNGTVGRTCRSRLLSEALYEATLCPRLSKVSKVAGSFGVKVSHKSLQRITEPGRPHCRDPGLLSISPTLLAQLAWVTEDCTCLA